MTHSAQHGSDDRTARSARLDDPDRVALADDVAAARWERDDSRRGHGPALGPLLFVPCLLVFLAGLWLMGLAVDVDSGALFCLGILAAGAAFLVPLHLLRR